MLAYYFNHGLVVTINTLDAEATKPRALGIAAQLFKETGVAEQPAIIGVGAFPHDGVVATWSTLDHYAQAFLLRTLKEIFGADRHGIERVTYDDGHAILGALDAELIERAIHAIDVSFKPTRPDSAVMPCPHGCEYCRTYDTPSN
ncbi:MAG: hypothetical protein WB439_04765 [Acidobacteriaceae bacterium]